MEHVKSCHEVRKTRFWASLLPGGGSSGATSHGREFSCLLKSTFLMNDRPVDVVLGEKMGEGEKKSILSHVTAAGPFFSPSSSFLPRASDIPTSECFRRPNDSTIVVRPFLLSFLRPTVLTPHRSTRSPLPSSYHRRPRPWRLQCPHGRSLEDWSHAREG